MTRRSPLRSRDFHLVAGAVGLSALGDWVAIVALGLHVKDLTDSGLAVAALWVCLFGPSVAVAGHAGLLVDRVEATRLLTAVSLLGALVAAVLGLTTGTAALLSLTALLGPVFAILQPAEFALIPPLAGNRIQEANGHVETARYVGFGLGPLLGGLLFTAGGPELAMLLDAATFVAVAGAALALRVRREPRALAGAERTPRARDGRRGSWRCCTPPTGRWRSASARPAATSRRASTTQGGPTPPLPAWSGCSPARRLRCGCRRCRRRCAAARPLLKSERVALLPEEWWPAKGPPPLVGSSGSADSERWDRRGAALRGCFCGSSAASVVSTAAAKPPSIGTGTPVACSLVPTDHFYVVRIGRASQSACTGHARTSAAATAASRIRHDSRVGGLLIGPGQQSAQRSDELRGESGAFLTMLMCPHVDGCVSSSWSSDGCNV